MASDGIADFVYVNPGYQPGRFPIIAAGELPFLVGQAKGGNRAIDAWYRKYAASRDEGCALLLLLRARSAGVAFQQEEDRRAGRRQRHEGQAGSRHHWRLGTQLGGTNVQSSAPEVRDILAKGVADAITFPWGSMLLFGIDKVTKYDMDEPLGSVMFQWLMSPATYAAMSASQKKVIDEHCTTEWAAGLPTRGPTSSIPASRSSRPSRTTRSTRSTTRNLPSGRSLPSRSRQKWADDVKKAGGDPDVIWNDLQASLKQYNAGF